MKQKTIKSYKISNLAIAKIYSPARPDGNYLLVLTTLDYRFITQKILSSLNEALRLVEFFKNNEDNIKKLYNNLMKTNENK